MGIPGSFQPSKHMKITINYRTITHLMMSFILYILSVHLHQSVTWSQPGQVSRGAGLDFADKLSSSIPLAMQMKSIATLSFDQKTKPWSQLDFHPSASVKEGNRLEGLGRISRCFA